MTRACLFECGNDCEGGGCDEGGCDEGGCDMGGIMEGKGGEGKKKAKSALGLMCSNRPTCGDRVIVGDYV